MRAALTARVDGDLVIAGRTSAPSISGIDDAIRRAKAYQAAGVDAIFLVGVRTRADLDAVAAEVPDGATLVVFHTAVLMYLDEAGRARFADHVRRLPGRWLSVESRTVTPGIRVREDVPNESSDLVLAVDGVQLAWAQPHGRGIRWVPDP